MLIHETAAPASQQKAPREIYEGFVASASAAIEQAVEGGTPVTGAMYMRQRTAHELETAYERALGEARRLVELASSLVASLERYGTASGGNNFAGQAENVREALTTLRLRSETYRMADTVAAAERKA